MNGTGLKHYVIYGAFQEKLERAKAQTRARRAAQQASAFDSEDGIIDFVRRVLRADPTPYQERALRTLYTHRRLAVRAPHGAGKTALSAWVVWWGLFAFPNDTKVITTASVWRQLIHFTWGEIRKWSAAADWGLVNASVERGKNLLETHARIGDNEAFAVASDNPAFIEGAHAAHLIYVFDEAKAIPGETFDAAEGAFSGAGSDTGSRAWALAISTPGTTSGRFYDLCMRRAGYHDWQAQHITLDECIAAGRISRDWARARALQWGETSAVYRNRVLAEFDESGEDAVIPHSWIALAQQRWRDWRAAYDGDSDARAAHDSQPLAFGVDPAYKGDDATAIAVLRGRVLERIETYRQESTMNTAGRIAALVGQGVVAIDIIGVGAGVYDRVRELGLRAIGVNVARASDLKGRGGVEFVNLRAALWWMLREALDPEGDAPIALPPDDALADDLAAATYWYASSGKIQIEAKDELRARLGRSPDKADALALALYAARYARIGWIV